MSKIAVFIIKEDSFKGIEGEAARRVSRHLLLEGNDKILDLFEIDGDGSLLVRDLFNYKGYDVFVFIYGILFITYEGINVLSRIALNQKKFSVIVPMTNESKILYQRHAPPYIYQTISVLKWAVKEIYDEYKDNIIEADEIDNFCLALRSELLDVLPEDGSLIDLPKIVKNGGLRFGVAKGVYAHRYGNCYESGRDDLLEYVPLDAREVLDIGSAGGLFGEMLKKRQECFVTGVESDRELVDIAGARLDYVTHGDVETILDEGRLGLYDCIVCGDVLEHLNNPWKVVKLLRRHLKAGGLFIASSPNVTNWAIICEMLNGRWDYIPFSILSGTHIRFFTRNTYAELFEEAGYRIKELHFQSFNLPRRGCEFIARLKELLPEIREEELKANEIVIVAEG